MIWLSWDSMKRKRLSSRVQNLAECQQLISREQSRPLDITDVAKPVINTSEISMLCFTSCTCCPPGRCVFHLQLHLSARCQVFVATMHNVYVLHYDTLLAWSDEQLWKKSLSWLEMCWASCCSTQAINTCLNINPGWSICVLKQTTIIFISIIDWPD